MNSDNRYVPFCAAWSYDHAHEMKAPTCHVFAKTVFRRMENQQHELLEKL
jgi:hypothetical protein